MIIRQIPQSNFWVAPNAAFDGCGLSFEARGVLAYLSGKPPAWEVSVPDLCREGDCGKDRVYRILQELEKAGFLCRSQLRDERGTFLKNDYVVSPFRDLIAQEIASYQDTAPLPGNPLPEKPLPEKPDTYKEQSAIKNVPDKAQVPAPVLKTIPDQSHVAEQLAWADFFQDVRDDFGQGTTFTRGGKPRSWAGQLAGAFGAASGGDPIGASDLYDSWVADMKRGKTWAYITSKNALERSERWLAARRDSGKTSMARQQPAYEALYG